MTRRAAVLVLLLALVAGGLVLDTAGDDEAEDVATSGVADPEVFPIASAADALSSTWYCAGGTADEEAFADHVVAILNRTDATVTVRLTAYGGTVLPPAENAELDELDPDAEEGDDTENEDAGDEESGEESGDEDTGTDGESGDDEADGETTSTTTAATGTAPDPVVREIEIPALARRRVALSDVLAAPIASALVEAPVGGVVVEHEVTSIHGHDAKPCATAASDQWHFAWGTTEREARELLVLFNPFPDDAIVDGIFSTEDGIREPARFDGLVVPARSTIALDLGDDVTRRAEVAASITARTGRIVVDRILRLDESDGARGLTVQLGVPRPQGTWVFPDGFVADDVTERFVLYNPGEEVAEVSIEFVLDRPDENGIPQPIDVTLAPGTQATVDLNADGRVPAEVGHSAIVRSANDVPIVAERVLTASRSSRRGVTVTTGSPLEATTWSFAAGSANADAASGPLVDEWLYLLNLDPEIVVTVDVFALVGGQLLPVSQLQGVTVEAGQRLSIRIGEYVQRPDLPLLVRASEPLVAERGLYRSGEEERGMSNAVGVPDPDGVRFPGDPLEVEVDADLGDDDLDLDAPTDPDAPPTAPDDVELPGPDETIVIDDPDAEAEDPDATTTTTTAAPDTAPTTGGESSSTTGGVPDTSP